MLGQSVKYGTVRKPTVTKTYICVFLSLSVKAIRLELVSDLTTGAFIASLRRFVARRGKPSLIWSDHGSNFVGAARELKELSVYRQLKRTFLTSVLCKRLSGASSLNVLLISEDFGKPQFETALETYCWWSQVDFRRIHNHSITNRSLSQ